MNLFALLPFSVIAVKALTIILFVLMVLATLQIAKTSPPNNIYN